jgi:hypothetical protein
MADVDLKRFPSDVQRLLKTAGISKVSNYAGRLRDRPQPEKVSLRVNGSTRAEPRSKTRS